MIDFRYHLVSIVAVFLALAIGIVLGSTELQGPAFSLLDKTTSKLQSELGQVSSQRDTAQQQATEGELYAQAVEPAVLRDLLTGHRLLIVTEPGAQSSVVSGITTAAIHAGASVTGEINLQPKFFDTSGTAQDSLNQTTLDVAQTAGIQLDTSATYQQQAAQVIASEILTASSASAGSQPGGDQGTNAATMLQAYAASQFLSTSGQPASAGHPGRRRDPAERAVGRQRGPARPGAHPAGPGAGGEERRHRGRGLVGGLGRGQPDLGAALEQRGQPGVHGRRRRPGGRADRRHAGARRGTGRRQGRQLRLHGQRRQRHRAEPGAHPVRVRERDADTSSTKKKAKK